MKLALAPVKAPTADVADMVPMKIGVWRISFSCRRYAKDDMEHPRTRHDPSIEDGDGSSMYGRSPVLKSRGDSSSP